MDKNEFIKNRLDNEYKFESQKAIAFITFGTVTMLGLIVTLIINKLYVFAVSFGFLFTIIARALYMKTKKKMDKILNRIEDIGSNLELSFYK